MLTSSTRVRCYFVQLGIHGMERIFIDNRNLHVLLFFQAFRQFFCREDTCITCADNDNIFQCFHLLTIGCRAG